MLEIISNFFIASVHATDQAAPVASPMGGTEQLVLLGGFVLVFYLLIWRPQSKRAKEHKKLLAEIAVGNEVVAAGGIVAKVTKLTEQFAVLESADTKQLIVQKSSISLVLPKDTISSI
jgi:preprotein translocase subunit YajC